MGSGASRSLQQVVTNPGDLGDLPESCVASILLHLDPTEICRLASLSQAFSAAAKTDFVWNSKLPENYAYLIDKVYAPPSTATDDDNNDAKTSPPSSSSSSAPDAGKYTTTANKNHQLLLRRLSKKEIYALLCRPNSFDFDTKVFWLEKAKGGICMSISSKALSITGMDDRRYWNHITTDESRFHTVAYLQQIWWFEVDGEIEFCFPAGTYSLFFRLLLGRPSKRLCWRICDPSQIHGWDKKPVRFQLSTTSGRHSVTQCYLDEPGKWIHFHVGDFVVENSNMPTKVKFSMMQIDCTHTKGGLCVDSVSVYPKGCRPAKHRAS